MTVELYYEDDYATLLHADVIAGLQSLPAGSVQCVVTSPPYWGLRDYGVDGQLGSEELHDCLGWATGTRCEACFICRMVRVFSEVKRVLRDDGTLWLNIGDSYNGSGGAGGDYSPGGLREGQPAYKGRKVPGLKAKDLCLVPERLALALQAEGWWVRSQITWEKATGSLDSAQDRPQNIFERIWLLSKSARYFFDVEPAREDGNARRNVWRIAPESSTIGHFARFPSKLPERAIRSATSAAGCCATCGAPWRRLKEPTPEYAEQLGEGYHNHYNDAARGKLQEKRATFKHARAEYITFGWGPTCSCNAGDPVPCTVLDPFLGSGTTVAVANELGRKGIGIDLSADYLALAVKRIRPAVGLQTSMMVD